MAYTGLLKLSSLRGPSAVSQDGAGKRIESDKGYAISRNQKKHIGNKRYEIVETWTVKTRVDGKVVTAHTGVSEEFAKQWLGISN